MPVPAARPSLPYVRSSLMWESSLLLSPFVRSGVCHPPPSLLISMVSNSFPPTSTVWSLFPTLRWSLVCWLALQNLANALSHVSLGFRVLCYAASSLHSHQYTTWPNTTSPFIPHALSYAISVPFGYIGVSFFCWPDEAPFSRSCIFPHRWVSSLYSS